MRGRRGREDGRPHNPVFRYLRGRLHRRLFVWFGVTIFVSLLVASTILWPTRDWQERAAGLDRFAADRLAEVWDQPAQRDRLAASAARDLALGLALWSADGRLLGRYGHRCDDPYDLEVRRAGRVLGVARVCTDRWTAPRGSAFRALLAAATVLWVMSGFVAVRMTRPLVRLMQVVRELGDGKLDARVRLRHFGPGELAVLATAVNDMAARIEKQLVDARELLAAVSHEIRTPLGHMRLLLELLRPRVDPAARARLDELEREVVTIDALVGQLLARSRVDFGALQRRPVDAIQLALGALERAGLESSLLEVTGRAARFQGDAGLLLQALANLLRNAEEHGGGVEVLRVRRDDGAVVFEVEDRGPGFDPDQLEAAFESFRRGAGSGGTLGLGLSLVRRIALAHGGRAWAENLPGRGARVSLLVQGERLELTR